MAFGFVVEKFGLFLNQISAYLGKEAHVLRGSKYSSLFGLLLVLLGMLISVLSYIRYKKVDKQIDEESYRPSSALSFVSTAAVVIIGIFLVLYLI